MDDHRKPQYLQPNGTFRRGDKPAAREPTKWMPPRLSREGEALQGLGTAATGKGNSGVLKPFSKGIQLSPHQVEVIAGALRAMLGKKN